MNYETISPTELAQRIRQGERVRLIDVREHEEHQLASITEAQLLPLSRFADQWGEWAQRLSTDEEIVVMCHHGIRSAQVCQFLAKQGFTKMVNLAGGIDRWSCEVDRQVPRY